MNSSSNRPYIILPSRLHLYFTHTHTHHTHNVWRAPWVGWDLKQTELLLHLIAHKMQSSCSRFTLTFEGEVNKHQGVELRLSESINQATKRAALIPQGFWTKESPPQRLSLHLCPSSSASCQNHNGACALIYAVVRSCIPGCQPFCPVYRCSSLVSIKHTAQWCRVSAGWRNQAHNHKHIDRWRSQIVEANQHN